LNDECRKYLEETDKNQGSDETKSLWGGHIKCEIPGDYVNDTSLLQDFAPALPTETKAIIDFSMKYDQRVDNQPKPSSSKQQEQKYTRSWLTAHINADLIDNLTELLKSAKSNEELQNELFDFLGFDKFEFIMEVLQNRKHVLDNATKPIDKINVFKEKAAKKLQALQHAPNYLMPVMVQSETEKQLRKQVQKEEKKLKKFLNAAKIDDDEEDEELDPVKMRMNYQKSLLMAEQMRPLLDERPITRPKAPPRVVK
jgi:activating signal cointegrator complex subunit 3